MAVTITPPITICRRRSEYATLPAFFESPFAAASGDMITVLSGPPNSPAFRYRPHAVIAERFTRNGIDRSGRGRPIDAHLARRKCKRCEITCRRRRTDEGLHPW